MSNQWKEQYEALQGQISTMLDRCERYQSEAEAEKDLSQGELHANAARILCELHRLSVAFAERAIK